MSKGHGERRDRGVERRHRQASCQTPFICQSSGACCAVTCLGGFFFLGGGLVKFQAFIRIQIHSFKVRSAFACIMLNEDRREEKDQSLMFQFCRPPLLLVFLFLFFLK